ncbi:LPS export ABC transporter periplasmic protein LptC [Aliarcobacter lanthieri]|uniref:LPS export ABC transporter periplasmic protein LptC n=1 Tax=Aliarcobacter lanthieri TaxID=1355374 RepID=UPI003AFAA37D
MGLKIFVGIIFIISIFFYFTPIKETKKDIKNEDIALFIFEKPNMYSFDKNGLTRIIIAEQAIRYENRDEMYFGDITINNSNEKRDFKSERIKANFIVKKGAIYTLKEDVEYLRDDFVKIYTQHLIYDDLNKIAKNNKPFKAEYYTHKYNGENLYFNIDKDIINSKNTHFEIDMKK